MAPVATHQRVRVRVTTLRGKTKDRLTIAEEAEDARQNDVTSTKQMRVKAYKGDGGEGQTPWFGTEELDSGVPARG